MLRVMPRASRISSSTGCLFAATDVSANLTRACGA